MLRTRYTILRETKDHLLKDQVHMKKNTDKGHKDLFLWDPWSSQVVVISAKAFCQKLAAKFYSPFKVLENFARLLIDWSFQMLVKLIWCFMFPN